MENAPSAIVEQHKRSQKRCDTRAVLSISFLIASQVLKLSYFVYIWLGLEEIETTDGYGTSFAPQFLEITSLGLLYGAFLGE